MKRTTALIGIWLTTLAISFTIPGSASKAATITDVDGNVYGTVTIGTQVWMAEDLKTTRYRNGDAIGTTQPATLDIRNASTPKYQWAYNGDENYVAVYARLYTWYAVADSRGLAPVGWHVPTDAEWATLINYLGGEKAAQGKLKEAGAAHWNSPNADATNASGFTALPGGNRDANGEFLGLGDFTHWWTASEQSAPYAWRRALWKDAPMDSTAGYSTKTMGWLVRCVRDAPAGATDPNGPIHNLTTGDRFTSLQTAVNCAQPGHVIQVAPGIYPQSVTISGKDITLQSIDPNDPNVAAGTVIVGSGADPVVAVQNGTERCVLAGLTIRGGRTGLRCTGGKPVIRACQIIENTGSGIELLAGTQPTIDHCVVAANGAAGVKLVPTQARGTMPLLTNCTLVQNAECGFFGMATLRNCILYFNGTPSGSSQIVTTNARVTCSCVQGGFTGEGNIASDPLFARLGAWAEPNGANHPAGAWISGDYHLESQAGRWDPVTAAWVQDEQTSPCIDAAHIDEATGPEPDPNGAVLNLGAYGGAMQASKSPTETVPAGSLRVTYVANEGFLLIGPTRRVLIDAVFSDGFNVYAAPSSALLQKMREGQGPFGDLDVLCVTHQDADHFSGSLVRSLLTSRPEVAFLSCQQVTSQIPNVTSLGDRVVGLSLSVGQTTSVVPHGVPIEVTRMTHGEDSTGTGSQNMAFLVDLDGIRILHTGDSGFDANKARYEALNLTGRVDVLFISGYDLSTATQAFVRDVIRPRYVIGMHLAPAQLATTAPQFLSVYSNGIVFQKTLESRLLVISPLN